MGLMTTARATLPSGPWTVDDLDDFPEGSTTRYELIDGALIVSAEPSLQHQRVNLQIARLLQDTVPDDLEVFLPVDVRLSPFRQIAPDVTVVRRGDATGKRLSGLPLLIVEVQSPAHGPSTWHSSARSCRRPASRRTGWWTPTTASSPSSTCRPASTSRSHGARA